MRGSFIYNMVFGNKSYLVISYNVNAVLACKRFELSSLFMSKVRKFLTYIEPSELRSVLFVG